MQEDQSQPGAYHRRPVASCDQEAVIKDRILTAMLMAIEVKKKAKVQADEHLWSYGLRGIAEGCAREVIEELGMQPEFCNIRPSLPIGHDGPIPEHMIKHFCEMPKQSN